jgi:hemerythrin superfamily protein
MSTATRPDIVNMLLDQHQTVRTLLDRVLSSTGEQRGTAFDEVRELLARHETGEEMILRPMTRRVPGGEAVAEGRMTEENEAKKVLAELEKLDVQSTEFESMFQQFRLSVLEHAEAEEQEEFPLMRKGTFDDEDLLKAGRKLESAERMAPTHPHPSAKTTAMNYVAGPFAAMVDRARDLFSKGS